VRQIALQTHRPAAFQAAALEEETWVSPGEILPRLAARLPAGVSRRAGILELGCNLTAARRSGSSFSSFG